MSELVDAWRAWERWASRKRRAFTGREGKPEAARLTSALVAVSEEHGVPHMVLHDRIAEGRRDGLSVEDAVARAVS